MTNHRETTALRPPTINLSRDIPVPTGGCIAASSSSSQSSDLESSSSESKSSFGAASPHQLELVRQLAVRVDVIVVLAVGALRLP